MTETLLESELFGHVRGSFSGAYRDKAGQLQMAHRGTLFLDEVGEMSLRMQALLLRFLENGEIQPVGADHARTTVDVRVIAATHRNLKERVAAGEFREDLLYRLRVISLSVPPLRDRPEDIPALVESFVARFGRQATVSPAAMQVLLTHRWPGNVRELQNVIEETLALSSTDVIEPADLPHSLAVHQIRLIPQHERRRQVADDLYQALVTDGCSFFEHVHPRFLSRDITRHDIRELVRRGLATTRGNYRALLPLFGMSPEDYKRFLNFLTTHDCNVDFRKFRSGEFETAPRQSHRGASQCRWAAWCRSRRVRNQPRGSVVSMTPVADLRRPAFALQWHEAVAVVAELADTMRASGLARVPTPESILITADGTLHADVGTALEGLPSRELAGLLGGLLVGVVSAGGETVRHR